MSKEKIIRWLLEFLKIEKKKSLIKKNFMNENYIDSLGIMKMISSLEKKFNFKFKKKDYNDPRFQIIEGLSEIVLENVRTKKNNKKNRK